MGRIIAFLFLLAGCEEFAAQPVAAPSPGSACQRATASYDAKRVDVPEEAVREIDLNVECFDGAPFPPGDMQRMFRTGTAREFKRLFAERDAMGGTLPSGFRETCERFGRVMAIRTLAIDGQEDRDRVAVLCAYADASDNTPNAYLSALAAIEAVRDETLKAEARKDLVGELYLRYYADPKFDFTADAFRETYPLASVMDPQEFGTQVLVPRLRGQPVPVRFLTEQKLDDERKRELLYAHFVRQADANDKWLVVVDLVDTYVQAGYDAASVGRVAYDVLLDAEAYVEATKVANRYLDAGSVRRAEDGRIKTLEDDAQYSVVIGPDGRRSKSYYLPAE